MPEYELTIVLNNSSGRVAVETIISGGSHKILSFPPGQLLADLRGLIVGQEYTSFADAENAVAGFLKKNGYNREEIAFDRYPRDV